MSGHYSFFAISYPEGLAEILIDAPIFEIRGGIPVRGVSLNSSVILVAATSTSLSSR